jgi:hypothetical protein
MKNSTTAPPARRYSALAHPLELIPYSGAGHHRGRNLLYTVIWSSGMGVVLAALEMVLVRDGVSYSTRLGPCC